MKTYLGIVKNLFYQVRNRWKKIGKNWSYVRFNLILRLTLFCFSCGEDLGKEINTILKMEQDFIKLLSLSQNEKPVAFYNWCTMTEETLESWHLDTLTIIVLFDFQEFRVLIDKNIDNNVVCILQLF